jgi:hypothetical protein
MRKSYGQFKSVDDLCAIKGIEPKRMEKCASTSPSANPLRRKRQRTPGQLLQEKGILHRCKPLRFI